MNTLPLSRGRKGTEPLLPPAKILQSQIRQEREPETAQKPEPGGWVCFRGSKRDSAAAASLGREARALLPSGPSAEPRVAFCRPALRGSARGAPPCPAGCCHFLARCCGRPRRPQSGPALGPDLPACLPGGKEAAQTGQDLLWRPGLVLGSPGGTVLSPPPSQGLGSRGQGREPRLCRRPTEGFRVPSGTRVLSGRRLRPGIPGPVLEQPRAASPRRCRAHATGSGSERKAWVAGQRGAQCPFCLPIAWAPGPALCGYHIDTGRGHSSLDAQP